MLDNCTSAQERWGGVSEIIDRWLEERKLLLVQYCKLSEFVEEAANDSVAPLVQALCQIMVDYTSAGHFEVYDQLVKEGQEFDDKEGLKSAGESFKVVDATTEEILDFNDKYQETDDLDAILGDLSKLGETLASRFEAEDSMIEVLHVAHKHQVTE
ncbi:MAG: sigma D regulator [Agarilytica sp.]